MQVGIRALHVTNPLQMQGRGGDRSILVRGVCRAVPFELSGCGEVWRSLTKMAAAAAWLRVHEHAVPGYLVNEDGVCLGFDVCVIERGLTAPTPMDQEGLSTLVVSLTYLRHLDLDHPRNVAEDVSGKHIA